MYLLLYYYPLPIVSVHLYIIGYLSLIMETFAYTDEERDRISANAPSLLNLTNSLDNGDWTSLLNLYKNKARYTIHASSLNDYLKSEMIPRGLHIQKGPAVFRDNSSFNQKWRAILNKCTCDLILLITEQSMMTITDTDKEIDFIKEKLQNDVDAEVFSYKMHKIQEEVDALEKAMCEFKLWKFRRDKRDYTQDRVYNFNTRLKTKQVSWADTVYSDYDSTDGGESTGTSGDEGPSHRFTYGRVAKGKARQQFFQSCPQRRGRRKAK